MNKHKFVTNNEQETKGVAKSFSHLLRPGDIVCLFGDLGAGKTTFVKGLAEAFGINEKKVNSPTFVLMNAHSGKIKVHNSAKRQTIDIFHLDLYRLEQNAQILALGYEEYFYGEGISLVEWADRLGSLLPKKFIGIYFSHLGEDRRGIKVSFPDERTLSIK